MFEVQFRIVSQDGCKTAPSWHLHWASECGMDAAEELRRQAAVGSPDVEWRVVWSCRTARPPHTNRLEAHFSSNRHSREAGRGESFRASA